MRVGSAKIRNLTASDISHDVWAAFKTGDRNAFAELVECAYPFLFNYARRFQTDPELVKDCIHDLFLELWRGKSKLEGVITPKAYLLVSLRHLLFKETKRTKWFSDVNDVTEDYAFEVQFGIETYLIENEVQNEDLKRLGYQLQKLTKRQREAVYLRFYQQLEYEAIAEAMGISSHSAVNLVYEAIRFIRRNWIYP